MFSVNAHATFEDEGQARWAYNLLSLTLDKQSAFQSSTYQTVGFTRISDEVAAAHPGFVDETWHDDKTLMRVREALEKEEMSDDGIMVVINALLNAGILFRERVPE